jgi:hypothetical protein
VTQPLRFRLLVGFAVLASIAALGASVAAAAGSYDFRYGSGIYKGSVADCQTSATVGLAKAGFSDVHSESHASNSAVYGSKSDYQAVVICTKAESTATYTELVFGPSGSTLPSLFDALDNNFK